MREAIQTVIGQTIILAIFRLECEDDYEYEISVLSMRFRFGGRKFSKCACSELKLLRMVVLLLQSEGRYCCIEVKQIY